MTTTASKHQVCPECGATITVHPEFVPWCEKCDWNLQPAKSEYKPNVIGRIYLALGKRQNTVLFERFANQESLQPKLTISKIIAFLIATIVYCLMIAMIVLGVILILSRTFIIPLISVPLGLASLGAVWLVRPRFNKPPKFILTPEVAPTLHNVLGRIANHLQIKAPEIAIDGAFNASMGRYTWRQQEIVNIGLSLWSILTPEERLAILGHELAHSANKDPFRSIYISIALNSLNGLVLPIALFGSIIIGHWGLLYIPLVLFIFAPVVTSLIAYALIHLLWRDKQRAEYLADDLASSIGGTESTITALKKLPVARSLGMALQRFVLTKSWRDKRLFEALKEQAALVPETEFKRLVRLEQQEGSRLDVTHPPIALRIKMLQQHPFKQPQIIISEDEWKQIDLEFARVEEKVEKQLIDRFRESRGF